MEAVAERALGGRPATTSTETSPGDSNRGDDVTLTDRRA